MRLLKVNILDFSLFPPSHLQAVCIYTILSAKASPFTCAYKSILFSKPVFSNRTLCNDEIVLYFLLSKTVVSSHMWLLGNLNVAGMTEGLN